jgi:DNA primase
MTTFEVLRQQVLIEQVAGGRVGEKVLCPAHADGTTPNLHIYDDYVHCYACGFHGDVVDVWAAVRGFEGPVEAALDLAREFGLELPDMDPEVRRKAQERRERENLNLRQAQACHKALEKHPKVREWWEGRGFGKGLQERFLLGANCHGTSAVIPHWHRGRVQGLIHRKLEGKPKYRYPKAEDFPSGYRPLFVPGSLRGEIFLVEGIVDALALAALEESVVAVGGADISQYQMRELESLSGPLYILPDTDEAGEEAARRWALNLYPRAFVCPAHYGEEAKHV